MLAALLPAEPARVLDLGCVDRRDPNEMPGGLLYGRRAPPFRRPGRGPNEMPGGLLYGGQPTLAALDQVLDFFRSRLLVDPRR